MLAFLRLYIFVLFFFVKVNSLWGLPFYPTLFVADSNETFYYLLVLPVQADGPKGKTWGPSSSHQKERGKIITKVTDSPKRMSKSAPNLEKSQKLGSTSNGSGHTMQELGNSCYSIFVSSLLFWSTAFMPKWARKFVMRKFNNVFY